MHQAGLAAYLQGLALSASLIVAIGAQNAYVLRQGLLRRHVFALASLCFVSDALLIALGCAGFGSLVQAHPRAVQAVSLIGAAFLIAYGLRSLRSAVRGGHLDAAADGAQDSRMQVLLRGAAVTWLNPHVYLDTVLLLGGIAGRYAATSRITFALGAMSASAIWFYSLGYGAAHLAPLFRSERVWRALDAAIALVMWAIAASLLRSLL